MKTRTCGVRQRRKTLQDSIEASQGVAYANSGCRAQDLGSRG